jgi:hypothetical protein
MAEKTVGKQPASARKQRGPGRQFEKGKSGNPAGRPEGSRHKASLAAEVLLDGEAEAITRKCIEMALDGDATAMRLALERIMPIRRGRPVKFDLPPVASINDIVAAVGSILHAVAGGVLTVEEGQAVANILEAKRRSVELVEIERRLAELESEHSRRNY